jgi:hypothetical protein
MCAGEPAWQEIMRSQARGLLEDCNVDGIYLDETFCYPGLCYAGNHRHEWIGGGYHAAGIRELHESIGALRQGGVFTCGENLGESYIDVCTALLNGHSDGQGDSLPLFQTVFSDRTSEIGLFVKTAEFDDVDVFASKLAFCLLRGRVLGWFNSDQRLLELRLEKYIRQLELLKAHCTVRLAGLPWLYEGEMLRRPNTSQLEHVTKCWSPWGSNDEKPFVFSAVEGTCYRAADGRLGIVLANMTDMAQKAVFPWNGRDWGGVVGQDVERCDFRGGQWGDHVRTRLEDQVAAELKPYEAVILAFNLNPKSIRGSMSNHSPIHHGGKKLLRKIISTEDGRKGVSGLVSSCFQVTPDLAAIAINMRTFGKSVCDFELGHDVYLFDSYESIGESEPLTFLRSFEDRHPDNGSMVYYSRYDGFIGFVPVGATLADGHPHPHAGTGFCIGKAIAIPLSLSQSDALSVYDQNAGCFFILTQLEFKDGTLHATERNILRPKEFFSGCLTSALGAPLFDGEDILMPCCSVPPLPWGEGLLRMRRQNGKWRPERYSLVTAEPGTNPPMFSKPYPSDGLSGCECSVAPLATGEVLFTCREWGPQPWSPEPLEASRLRLWLGRPDQSPFRQTIEKPHFHTLSPITVSATWNGVPYLLANEYSQVDWKGKAISSLSIREKLLLYPLAGEDYAPQEPLVLCDVIKEFGPPRPQDGGWFADHPMGWRLKLGGRQRNFVTWRVFHVRETQKVEPSEHSGVWIAEIFDNQ